MRKTKRRQLKSIAAGERDARSVEPMKSPNSRVVEETNVDEDSWVIVRKQKIRVFIPPLSVAVTTDHEKSRNKRIQPGVRKRGRPKLQRKDDVSLLEKQKTQCGGEHQKTSGSNISAGLHSPANNEPSIVTPAIVAEAPNIVTGSSDGLPSQKDVEQGSNELSSKKNVDLTSHIYHLSEDQLLEDKDKNGDSGNPVNDSQNVVGEPSSTLQPLSEAARIPQEQHDFRPLETVQYPNSCRVQDRNIRALVLEHKLELAGGVNKWLISKGLERFVDIFQKEKMGNFELLSLTMERLKGMGLNAVGPRRKLMHAIDCLTQP